MPSASKFYVSSANFDRLKAVSKWVQGLPKRQPLLLLAPNRIAADDLARALCREMGGLWGMHRMTPRQLAYSLATDRLAAEGVAPLSRLGVDALAARSVHRCREDGPLDYFEPVADMPGFSRALAKTLRELRLEEVSASDLDSGGAPGRDLARLLLRFENELDSASLADDAHLLRRAREALAQDSPWRGIPVLLLDLSFSTSLERAFLRTLSLEAPSALGTAFRGDELAFKTLKDDLAFEPVDLDAGSNGSEPVSNLHAVRRGIFTADETPERQTDETVDFFSAPGEGRECYEIARRIRFGVDKGLCFDRVAVLLRDPTTYLPLVEDALRRAGIPSYFSRGAIRPEPSGRAFLALLACVAEGLSASRFAEYLSLGQVPRLQDDGAPPEPPVPWVASSEGQLSFITPVDVPRTREDDPDETDQSAVVAGALQTPFQWERLMTDAAVIGGSDRWKRRLSGLETELGKRLRILGPDDETRSRHIREELTRLRHLKRFALPLIDHLDGLPVSACWGDWLMRLRRLAVTALMRPEPVLSVLAELDPMEDVGPVILDEVRHVLSDRLTFLRTESPERRYGKVFVGSVDEASATCFDWVFVPGLAEGIFPRKALEDPLLLDTWRREVSSKLSLLDNRFSNERLLLRTALAAAREKVIVSYPRQDSVSGRPRVPSFYALEVLRAAEGRLPDLHELEKRASQATDTRLGWPAPRRAEDALDDAEHDLAVLEHLLERTQASPGRARYLIEVNSCLARSLRTRWKRWDDPRWSDADGAVAPDHETLDLLASQKIGKRSYSPTALQHFAACPYRFFLYAIHRLRPREEVAEIEQLDPLTRGSLFHELQFEFFKELHKENLLPMTKESHSRILDIGDDVLGRVAELYEEELVPAIPRVWKSEIEDLRTDLRGWIQAVIREGPDWKPIHYEYAFGLPRGPERDPDSVKNEANVLGGVLLRGSIDLVEQNVGSGHLRVIDHKTGRSPYPLPRFVAGGEFLQPILYALAAEDLLGRRVDAGQLFYCTQRGDFKRVEIPLNDEARDKIRIVLKAAQKAIEKGFLPAAPREGACRYCDFRPVCGPYEELRTSKKSRKPLTLLHEVRALP